MDKGGGEAITIPPSAKSWGGTRIEELVGKLERREIGLGDFYTGALEIATDHFMATASRREAELVEALREVATRNHKDLHNAYQQAGHVIPHFEDCHAPACVLARETLEKRR